MRTDRTWVCVACALRCCDTTCPRCGARYNYDLRDPRAAEQIARRAFRAGPEARRAERLSHGLAWYQTKHNLVQYLLPAIFTLGFAVALLGKHFWYVPKLLLAGYVVCWIVLAVVIAVARTALEVKRDALAARGVRSFGLAPAREPASSFKRATVRGRVRCAHPLTAPITRRACVAFRLLGHAPFGPVDDARLAPFEVVTDEGPVQLEGTAATVALENFGKPLTLKLKDQPIVDFLQPRGLCLAAGEATLEEAILRVGDEVIIEGSFDEIAQPDGYRGTASVLRVFKDIPGSPLIIKRA